MSTWEAMFLGAWNLKWWIGFCVLIAVAAHLTERRSER